MSCKGVLNSGKHGGAHENKHDISFSPNINNRPSLTVHNHVTASSNQNTNIVQYGGSCQNSKNDGESVSLHFLTEDNFDSYEQSLVENNAEWLKVRCKDAEWLKNKCKALDSLEFGLPNSGNEEPSLDLSDVTEVAASIGISLCTDSNDPGLCVSETLESPETVKVHTSAVPTSYITSNIPDTTANKFSNSFVNVINNTSGDCFTLRIDSDVNKREFVSSKHQESLLAPHSSCVISNSSPQNQLSDEQRTSDFVGLDVKCRKSHSESFSNILVTNKNNSCNASETTVSSESSVLSGSFESKVNNDVCDISGSLDTGPLTDSEDQSKTYDVACSSAVVNDIGLTSAAPTQVNAFVLNAENSVGSALVPQNNIQNGNTPLATISISTDKQLNSTQILVNTTQGQQLYHINTADLTQATGALQPLAQPIPEQETSTSTCAGDAGNLTSGYLLVPLSPEKGSDGNQVLMSVPVQNVGGGILTPLSEGNAKKMWRCGEPGCMKIFRKLSKLKIHQMRHTGERPYKCSLLGCDWAFTTAHKLKRHQESHEGKKDYVCDYDGCARKFTTIYNLNSHKKLHDRPMNEACQEPGCHAKFSTKRQLDLHMKNHKGVERTFKCPVEGCDKVFYSSNCMGSHARVHQQDRDELVCQYEGCGKVFDRVCRLKLHTRIHTGEKPYVCTHPGCQWAFTTASKLKRHAAKHTGYRKWVCEVCNKAFLRAEHLKGHIITHTGIKPHVCPVEGCRARFTAKSSLYVHIKRHDRPGEKIIYHCPLDGCDKKYASKASLRGHLIKHCQVSTGGADSTHLDLIPLLAGGEYEETAAALEHFTQSDMSVATASAVSSISLTRPVGGSEDPLFINTSELAATAAAEQTFLTVNTGDTTAQITSNVVNQLMKTAEAQTLVQSATGHLPGKISISASDLEGLTLTRLQQEKFIQDNNTGSARTDYKSNLILSDRAKKRIRDRKDKKKQSTDDGIDETLDNVAPVPPFSTTESLTSQGITSQGITFRDPDTGILYVQTQLLQDDPPNPEMFAEGQASVADMASITSVASIGVTVSELTGSGINLQDSE